MYIPEDPALMTTASKSGLALTMCSSRTRCDTLLIGTRHRGPFDPTASPLILAENCRKGAENRGFITVSCKVIRSLSTKDSHTAASARLAVDKGRKSGSQLTLRWREMDSNLRFRARSDYGRVCK